MIKNKTRTASCMLAAGLLMFLAELSHAQTGSNNELRTWRDVKGNELKARLVRYRDGVVYLRDLRRNTIKTEPGKLSHPDQKYVLKLLRDQQKNDLADEFKKLMDSSERQTPNKPNSSGKPNKEGPLVLDGAATDPNSQWIEGRPKLGSMMDVGPGGNKPRKRATPKREVQPKTNPRANTSQPSAPDNSGKPDANIDPFADLRESPDAWSNEGNTTNTGFRDSAPKDLNSGGGYQPPTITNKRDDTDEVVQSQEEAATGTNGSSNQSIVLIALGIIGFLFLIMIALLVMVLVKSKAPQPRRNFY